MELLFGFCTYEVQLGTITVILCSIGVYLPNHYSVLRTYNGITGRGLLVNRWDIVTTRS